MPTSRSTAFRRHVFAVLSALTIAAAVLPHNAFAQSGGGGGGSSGGAAGGGSAGSGATGGTTGGGASGTLGGPTGTIGGPGSSTGGGSLNSTVPDRNTGATQVPSAGNQSPQSPANQGQGVLGRDGGSSEPRANDNTVVPPAREDAPSRSSGGPADQRGGAANGAGDGTVQGMDGRKSPAKAQNGVDPRSMEECMKVWEPATHMTKQQWRVTCRRTLTTSPMNMLGTP